MRAACPNCEAVYVLPVEMAARLPAAVRCAACLHVWDLTPDAVAAEASQPPAPAEAEAEAEADTGSSDTGSSDTGAPDAAAKALAEPAAEPVVEPSPAIPEPSLPPVSDPPLVVEPRRISVASVELWPSERVQWIVSGSVLLVLIALLFALHAPIGRAWPPMLRLYGLFGLG
ncbi:MAG TPA: zinc-ribbon domain-containing protein [Acidiphilium sp.]|nr:zinc-ribbon domain-containing protein [Acidiphilium sp.]